MPEGDTVWRTARHLDQALTGQTLTKLDLRMPGQATLDLPGRTILGTRARGKHLLTRLGEDHTLHTHLKMEGSWHLYRPGTPWRRPSHQARVVLHTPDWTAVGFSLGITEVVARRDEEELLGYLGPDLLGPDWDEAEALRRLSAAPDRTISEALIDQSNLAGIGNMYKCELCFLQGVDPRTPVRDVPDLARLVRKAKAVLEANKERVDQSTTGDLRPGQRLWVYRREQTGCRRCRTRVRVAEIGARTTYWCPRCQPAPATLGPG